MSLSKKLCLRSDSQNSDSFSDCFVNKFESKGDNYRRDSFSDRFCDDLCEDILQYLSLEDKLRIECVSKQFQRTVLKRQYELFINTKDAENHPNYLKDKSLFQIKRDHNYYYYYIEEQKLDSLKALLKKCPNITSIELDRPSCRCHSNPEKINTLFRLIIENCENLSEINDLKDINESNLKEFHRKFERKMKCLPFREFGLTLNQYPNIEKLNLECVLDDSIISQLRLDKTKELHILLAKGQEYILQTIIDNFPALIYLNVVIQELDYKPFRNISNLKHLIHFECIEHFKQSNEQLLGLLGQMAKNCQYLKSIFCRFDFNYQNSDLRQLLSHLKAFPALKRLNLWLHLDNNEGEDNIDVNQLFSFDLFKGFENITHFSLLFNGKEDSILKGIDINLPKLQFLKISCIFDTTPEEVKEMANILSRLSRLETLELKFKSGVDFKPIEEQITEKCRKIRKIEMKTV